MITVTVAAGTMTFVGPEHLLERPSQEEIGRRITENAWCSQFARHHVEWQFRLGYIETRLQLEYLCSEVGSDLSSYCYKNAVRMTANPLPRTVRGQRVRRGGH
jgi:hypothetical protein